MSAMDLDNDVSTVLATIRSETDSADLINILYQLEDFYERKLWHQLTLTLDTFYDPANVEVTPELKYKIYNLFIHQFASNLNPIKVVDFLLESFNNKPQDTLDNLLALKTQFIKELKREHNIKDEEDAEFKELVASDEAVIYANLQIARHYLLLDDLSASEEILGKLTDRFDSNDSINNFDNAKINAAFYLARCELYRKTENYNLYYLNALLYLSSVDNNLSEEEKVKLCYELCIAALLGDKIYNFGELILHDILEVIKDEASPYNWLYHLIQNLNAGNLKEFNKWFAIALQRSPFLTKFDLFLKQKIIIMSLLELISLKPTTNKHLSFSEISEYTGTPVNDVEHLIIKCFSLDLIKGYINQIDEVLVVTWLQPRILNLDQVQVLHNHLLTWNSQLDKLSKEIYKNGGSIWAGI
ncbi:26S proteasome regulatory particle [Scheffersomyces xylosifermentans]|uniref:26S proteasome regulatory particle n=1 Tax=Scheffersomyces xylosifermentans TaxID=1304137 RepID=UPI00315C66DD